MMTEEKRIEWFLELQEHPEQLTDEQLQQILADDEMRHLVQQLGFAKRAFKHDALKNDTTVRREYISPVFALTSHLARLLHLLSVYSWLRALPLPLSKLCEISARPNRNSPQQSKRQTLIQSLSCQQIRFRPTQFPLSHTSSTMYRSTPCSQPLLPPTGCRWSSRMKRPASSVSTLYGSVKIASTVS